MAKREKVPLVAGTEARIAKNVPTQCGSELRGRRCRVIQTYESEQKGGQEHAMVQLADTGAVIGVPTSAMGATGRLFGPTRAFRAGWERIFGGAR